MTVEFGGLVRTNGWALSPCYPSILLDLFLMTWATVRHWCLWILGENDSQRSARNSSKQTQGAFGYNSRMLSYTCLFSCLVFDINQRHNMRLVGTI